MEIVDFLFVHRFGITKLRVCRDARDSTQFINL